MSSHAPPSTSAAAAMTPTQPIPVPIPAPEPSRSEIERKLSLRSVSPQTRDSGKKLPRRPVNPPQPGSFASPTLAVSPAAGYDSDSSYTSSQPTFPTTQPSTGSPSLLTGTSVRDTGLSAIVERDREGVLALSEEEEEEEEGDEQSEEDGGRRPEAGEMRKGVEGERVVKSGYLLKKGERRKNWKKRWFVLRTEKMAYYKDEREYVLCRILDLRDIHTVASVQLKRHQFGFGIVTPKRTYYVEASSQAEMEAWILAMNKVRRNLAEQDERARQPEPTTQAGVASTSVQSPSVGTSQQGKLPALHIPRRESASQSQSVTTPIAPTGNVISPSRSQPPNLDSSISRMGIASPHSASPVDRSREVQDRATSSRREPSASSLSSSGQIPHPDLAFAPDHIAYITSSDEDDLFVPQGNVPLPSQSLVRDQPPAVVAQIQTDPNKVILSGYLMKMGFRRKVWKKRWFVLTSGMLVYTKSHMDHKVHRQIPISIILDALEWEPPSAPLDIDTGSDSSPETPRRLPFSVPTTGGGPQHVQHTFQVITPKRTFKLCAPTEEDEIKWLAALRTLINRERERGGVSPGIRQGGGGSFGATPQIPWTQHSQQGAQTEYGLGNVTSISQPSVSVPTIQEISPTPVPSSPSSTGVLPSPNKYQGGQASYFPPTIGEEARDPQSPATITAKHLSSASQMTIQPASSTSPTLQPQVSHPPPPSSSSSLPPSISTTSTNHPTQHRARSATQSAKAAVEVAVRKLHLGQGQLGGHGQQHGHGGGAAGQAQEGGVQSVQAEG